MDARGPWTAPGRRRANELAALRVVATTRSRSPAHSRLAGFTNEDDHQHRRVAHRGPRCDQGQLLPVVARGRCTGSLADRTQGHGRRPHHTPRRSQRRSSRHRCCRTRDLDRRHRWRGRTTPRRPSPTQRRHDQRSVDARADPNGIDGQPIEPSICSSISRLHSTAYSIGSVRVTGSMKPLMIIPMAWDSVIPRLMR